MSLIPDLYPGDGLVTLAAIVLLAISMTSVTSLVAARCLTRRPTVRYAILFAALVCCAATPLIATVVRVTGTSTFSWNVLPARPVADSSTGPAGVDPAIAQFLATVFAADDPTDHLGQRIEAAPAEPAVVRAMPPDRGTPPRANATTIVPISPAATTGRDMLRGALTLAAMIWLVGFAVRIIRLAAGCIHILAIRRSSRPFFAARRNPAIAALLCRLLGTRRLPTILVSDAIQSPFATGLFRGTVILPSGLAKRITNDQLCDVLIHECAHVLRRDPVVMLLQVFARSLFWPIPWVHWLSRELTCACEEICDNYVLGHRDPVQYAETLLRVATLVGCSHREVAWVGMLHWPGKLEARINGLIDHQRSTATRIGRLRPGLCLAALLLASIAICGITIRPRAAAAAPTPGATESSAAAGQSSGSTSGAGDATESDQEKNAEEKPADSAEGKTEPAASERREIEIWWGLQGFGQIFRQHVSQFNESQQLVTAKVRSFQNYAALQRDLEQAVKDGKPPDLAIIEIHQIASFASDGRIRPLDQFIAADPTFQPEDLLPGLMTNLRYQDKLYAIPMNRSTPILYYNKDRFIAAGLDPNRPPTTWEELRRMASSLTSASENQFGFLSSDSAWVFESLVWGNGGELMVDGKPAFAEAGAAPLQMWADMVHLDKSARFGSAGMGDFVSGRVAMVIDSAAVLNGYLSNSDARVGAAYLPSMIAGKTAVPTGGGAAVIPAAISPEQQAAAWAFIRFFVSSGQAAKWSQRTGYIPVRESARALLENQGLYDEYPEFTVAIKQLQFAREAPQVPHWATAWSILSEAMRTVVRDDAPALQTLKVAQQRVAKLLETGVVPKPEPAPDSK